MTPGDDRQPSASDLARAQRRYAAKKAGADPVRKSKLAKTKPAKTKPAKVKPAKGSSAEPAKKGGKQNKADKPKKKAKSKARSLAAAYGLDAQASRKKRDADIAAERKPLNTEADAQARAADERAMRREARRAAKKADSAARERLKQRPPSPQATGERLQVAALPWRARSAVEIEIMLVSSRETKRWVLPKGWPMKDRAPHDAAAQEAVEEAGVVGAVQPYAVGAYRYVKRMRRGDDLNCVVDVFPLHVERQLAKWPEMHERATRWFARAEAAEAVAEPDLRELILEFQPVATE